MNVQVQPHFTTTQRYLPFECVALVLQGGGALGAYQAGDYEALAEAGIQPDWVAGVSVGAINAAIIAGNPLNSRIDRLREFWTQVTSEGLLACFDPTRFGLTRGDSARNLFNHLSASLALANGAKGFFAARPVIPWLQPAGTIEAKSFYDTRYLKRTLQRLVDFDRLNACATRLSIGAVNVKTGNLIYFDTTTHTIRPEHVMASGALPRDRRRALLGRRSRLEHSSAMGGRQRAAPRHFGVPVRPVERTRQVSTRHARSHHMREGNPVFQPHPRRHRSVQARPETATRGCRVARKTAGGLENQPGSEAAKHRCRPQVYNIAHLIYRAKDYEGHSKDYEFSRLSTEEHWRAGYHDARRTLRHREVLERPKNLENVFTFDLAEDGRE
jgi:NTE family protein